MNFTGQREDTDKAKTYESIMRYMTPASDLITFKPDQDIHEVIEIMIEKRISGAPVLNENRELVGIISEKDCLKIIVDEAYHDMMHSKKNVSDYMTKDVETLSIEMDVVDVANWFLNNHYRRFPVVEEGVLRGQISRRDILKAARDIKLTTW